MRTQHVIDTGRAGIVGSFHGVDIILDPELPEGLRDGITFMSKELVKELYPDLRG